MSNNLVGVRPPPSGQKADFVNGENLQDANIALHSIMLFFVTCFVLIRLYTRKYITNQLAIDDSEYYHLLRAYY